MKFRNRKQILIFITEFLGLSLKQGKCLQGCGRRLKPGQMHFCSGICRNLYSIQTWGKGRPEEDLTEDLQASLRLVRKGVR